MGILSNVQNLMANGISGVSVIVIIAITLVSVVVLIAVCSGCLFGIKKLLRKLFRRDNEKDKED